MGRALLSMAIASILLQQAARASASREEAELLARAGHARYLVARYRVESGRPAPGDLSEAIRSLESALAIDPTNLMVLGYLGLARFESARNPDGRRFAPDALATAQEPLEELFRLSRGWADPATRSVLQEVAAFLDRAAGGDANVRVWWESWRPRLAASIDAPPTVEGANDLFRAAESSRVASERRAAVEELARLKAPSAKIAPVLGRILEHDESPMVRMAAGHGLVRIRARAWDVHLAEALKRDPSVWVRRECARVLGQADAHGVVPPGQRSRAALRQALTEDTPLVAAEAARTLGVLGEANDALIEHVSSHSPIVRSACALALASAEKHASELALLARMLDSPDSGVRASASTAIGSAGVTKLDDASRMKLASLLDDDDPLVRSAAIETSGGLGSASASSIEPLLSDPDPRVLLAAGQVLVRLSTHRDAALASLKTIIDSPVVVRESSSGGLISVGEMARRQIDEVE